MPAQGKRHICLCITRGQNTPALGSKEEPQTQNSGPAQSQTMSHTGCHSLPESKWVRAMVPEANHTHWTGSGRFAGASASVSPLAKGANQHICMRRAALTLPKCTAHRASLAASSRPWNPSAHCPRPLPALSCCRIHTEQSACIHSEQEPL